MFLVNSRHPLVCAPGTWLPRAGPSSPEVTRAICRVPSTPFSQAPWYALPVHLCRFRVRSIRWRCFLERPPPHRQSVKPVRTRPSVTSSRLGTVGPIPIAYGSRPRLRGRLTLRGLTWRRNPWTFGDRVSHPVCRYSCQHSHFRCLQRPSRVRLRRPTERSATAHARVHEPAASVGGLSPVTFSAQDCLFRPVSYYAFFKGWLLLSQPPGCHGFPTSFPT